MMKFFFVLLPLISITHIVQSQTDDGEVFIYGPDTPVYYPEILRDNVKVYMNRNKFDRLKAEYMDSNTIHPKLLLMHHVMNYEHENEQKFLERATKVIRTINSYFKATNSNPHVEVLLSGVVLMNVETDKRDWIEMYSATSELRNITRWVKNNDHQFEDLHYDLLIYTVPRFLCDDKTELLHSIPSHLVPSLSEGIVCSSKPGAVIGKEIGDDHPAYAMEISYMLGLSHTSDKKDSHWYTSTFEVPADRLEAWKSSTAAIISKNHQRHEYSCFEESSLNNDYA